MRIAVLAIGSRGDVQPYVALSAGLQRAGHGVRFVTTEEFTTLAHEHDLTTSAVPFSVQAALAQRSASRAIEGGSHKASFREFSRIAKTASVTFARTALEASEGVDAIVGGLSAVSTGGALARRIGVPFLPALNVPVDATSAWPGALFPYLRLGPAGFSHRVSHVLSRTALLMTMRAGANAARTEVLGASPLGTFAGLGALLPPAAPVLYGISRAILPTPTDWPSSRHVVGTWFLDPADDWTPDPALEAFLRNGDRPIYLGFGSMASDEPEATARTVVDAIEAANVRAIVHSGWARLLPAAPPENVHVIESVPHAWLLPRVAAAVHHGGAGTTAASLRAGVPTVVVPFHGDQAFWGKRVHDLGAGPEPIPRRRLTADRLAGAISEATSSAPIARRAAELAEGVSAEDGIGDAVAWIEARIAEAGRTAA